jgi:hypothetical protein
MDNRRLAPVPSRYSRQELSRVLFGGRSVSISKGTKEAVKR